ncbi:MAG: hypothetical protein IT548_04315 [Alphaproteobacteria bacterium]|nr:hypothetical protein [Alphaproteobacteria bacterium]
MAAGSQIALAAMLTAASAQPVEPAAAYVLLQTTMFVALFPALGALTVAANWPTRTVSVTVDIPPHHP